MTDIIIISTRKNEVTGDRAYGAHWCSPEEAQNLRSRLAFCGAKELTSYNSSNVELYDKMCKACNDAENTRLSPSKLVEKTGKIWGESEGERK